MKNLLKTILFFIVAIFFSACNSPTGGEDGDDSPPDAADDRVDLHLVHAPVAASSCSAFN